MKVRNNPMTIKEVLEKAAAAHIEANDKEAELRSEVIDVETGKLKKSIHEAKRTFADMREVRNAAYAKVFKELPHYTDPVNSRKTIGKYLRAISSKRVDEKALDEMGLLVEQKDLGLGSDGGGYLAPLEFAGMLIELLYKIPVIRDAGAMVLPMTSDQLQLPTESSTVSSNWTAELATITQSDPVFGETILAVNNNIGISRMSRQILLDSAINYNLVDWIMQRFAQAIGRAEDTAFMTGSGSGQPKGIRQYSFTHTNAQAGAHLAYSDVVAAFHALPVQYRQKKKCAWLMNDTAIKAIRSMVDTEGRPIYSEGFGQGFQTPGGLPSLFGYPVYIQQDIPSNLGAGTDATEVYFGAWEYYVIGEREQVFSEVSTEEGTSFAQHRAAVKVGERIDGQLTEVDPISQLTGVIQ